MPKAVEQFFYHTQMALCDLLHPQASPARANLVMPLYCNVDVPSDSGVINCSEWNVSSLPLPDDPISLQNFSSTRSVSPLSPAFQSLNPYTGRFLLTDEQYEAFVSGLYYVVLYRENDADAGIPHPFHANSTLGMTKILRVCIDPTHPPRATYTHMQGM